LRPPGISSTGKSRVYPQLNLRWPEFTGSADWPATQKKTLPEHTRQRLRFLRQARCCAIVVKLSRARQRPVKKRL